MVFRHGKMCDREFDQVALLVIWQFVAQVYEFIMVAQEQIFDFFFLSREYEL